MKRFFIDDWPNVKSDHDEISKKIITVFDEHQRKKIKNNELKEISNNTQTGSEKIESLLVTQDNSRNRKKSDNFGL